MHRFRTRRKTKAEADQDAPSVPALSGKTFRRNKKPVHVEPDLDLANALPSTDHFRTSLLMPKLSARFSMLRDQDDFVLPPADRGLDGRRKRTSRLVDVLDLPDPLALRPGLAGSRARSDHSLADGYCTDDDSMYAASVLSRARPGEGNVLFGGRQKVYKVSGSASASTKNVAAGRLVYDHDVQSSTFHAKPASPVRPSRAWPEEGADDVARDLPSAIARSRSDSPPLDGYNHRRETSSSTASAPSNQRTSTAATSVASQPAASASRSPPAWPSAAAVATAAPNKPERAPTKSRRLYDHGLDQHIHDQQSSALSRLDLLARGRAGGTTSPPPESIPPLSHANSSSSLRERIDRFESSAAHAHPLRAVSPTPSTASARLASFNFGSRTNSVHASPPTTFPQSPPLSPVAPTASSFGDLTTIGKADGRDGVRSPPPPPPGHMTPPSRHSSDQDGPVDEFSVVPGDRPGRKSSASEPSTARPGPTQLPPLPQTRLRPGRSTFLASFVSSDAGSDVGSETEGERILGLDRPSESTQQPGDAPPLDEPAPGGALPAEDGPVSPVGSDEASAGPLPGPGLSGLVRQHLRSDSGQSSVRASSPPMPRVSLSAIDCAPEDFIIPGFGPPPVAHAVHAATMADGGAHEGAAAREHATRLGFGESVERGRRPVAPSRPVAPVITHGREPSVPGRTRETASRHVRGASSETKKAREEFAHELAHRRRMVQDNLKSYADGESRAVSPGPDVVRADTKRISPTRGLSPFGMLRGKPSGASAAATAVHADASGKALKMLGIAVTTEIATEETSDPTDRPAPAAVDEGPIRRSVTPVPLPPPGPARNWGQIRRDARRDLERRQREMKDAGPPTNTVAPAAVPPTNWAYPRAKTPSPPSSSGSARARSRSGSDLSGGRARGKSSTREDVPRTTAVSAISHDYFSGRPHPPAPPPPLGPPPPRPAHPPTLSPDPARPPTEWPRYHDPAPLPGPSPTSAPFPERFAAVAPRELAPRPSPIAPYSIHPTPSLPGSAASSKRNSPTSEHGRLAGTVPAHCKKVVHKSEISEPTLVSWTSNITTVDLPTGGRLAHSTSTSHGPRDLSAPPPPLPAINPRRRTRYPPLAVDGAAAGRGLEMASAGHRSSVTWPSSEEEGEEKSTFSDDDSPPPAKSRLWKPSSEGGNMHARYRHQLRTRPAPAVAPPPPPVPRSTVAMAVAVAVAADGAMF
ncbi:MAG: hypothetical protein M1826_004607 [Phylliscum demangeonii]|nr:MAG: hypothetical protein M1826_004607 [Phylliscum demangeonii]